MASQDQKKSGSKCVTIKVRVEPRSSRAGITGPFGDGLKVRLTSPPVDGKANRELVEILSKEFGVSKSDVQILSGERSKNKLVRLTGLKDRGNLPGRT